tara:strand:+ start:181 stop:417 length:237 start_codon:yes stop_codon:yes gene_type:complete
MENQQVLNFIDNLRGKRAYEERKSKKLGFNSLYEYIENKLLLKAQAEADAKIASEKEVLESNLNAATNETKSCSCCEH